MAITVVTSIVCVILPPAELPPLHTSLLCSGSRMEGFGRDSNQACPVPVQREVRHHSRLPQFVEKVAPRQRVHAGRRGPGGDPYRPRGQGG